MSLILLLLAGQTYFGVDESRLAKADRYWLGGKEVPRERITQLFNRPNLPDPSARLRVTVIGDGRDAVLKDLAAHPAFAACRGRCDVRGYPADHWHIKPGFVVSGRPTVYVQSHDGTVLHRQDDYVGGAEALAAAVDRAERLRRPPPDYRPDRDKDLRRPLLRPAARRVPWGVVVLGVLAVAAVAMTGKKR